MTETQKIIKYFALALAALLVVGIIGGIVTGISALISVFEEPDPNDILGEMETTPLNISLARVDMDLAATPLIIENGEEFSLQTNNKNLRIEYNHGILKVSEKQKVNVHPTGLVLILTIPTDHILTSFELDMGAGNVTIGYLTADNIDMDFGAGEVAIHNLNARKSADIDGGAGKITIKSGLVRDLDLDMGVGELDLGILPTGRCDMDMGVGSSRITISVPIDNYTVKIDRGLGSITLDGQKVSDGTYGADGGHTIDISGGVGSIDIAFVQE